MGKIFQEAAFDGKAPSPKQIAEKLEEIVGLPVILNESSPEISGKLYDFHARLAFARFPKIEIKLYTYRAGAVAESIREQGLDTSPIAKLVRGSNEPLGVQIVYLDWYIGVEPTLFYATSFALESLGGQLREPVSENLRREYGGRISEKELKRRWRKSDLKGLLRLSVGIVLLPVAIPFLMLGCIRHVMSFSQRISQANKSDKQM